MCLRRGRVVVQALHHTAGSCPSRYRQLAQRINPNHAIITNVPLGTANNHLISQLPPIYNVMPVYIGPNTTEPILDLEGNFRDCWSSDPTDTSLTALLLQLAASHSVVNSSVLPITVGISAVLVPLLFLFGMMMELPSSAASLRKRIADILRSIDIKARCRGCCCDCCCCFLFWFWNVDCVSPCCVSLSALVPVRSSVCLSVCSPIHWTPHHSPVSRSSKRKLVSEASLP